MVLPVLLGGALGAGLLLGSISFVSVLSQPVALLAGVVTAAKLLTELLNRNPIDELGEGVPRIAGYGGFSAVIGFLVYRITEAVLLAAGPAVGVALALVAVAVPWFGASSIATGILAFLRFVEQALRVVND